MKIIVALLLFCSTSFGQDIKGYLLTSNGDTIDITGFKRPPKPIEPTPIQCNLKSTKRYLTPANWGGIYINAKDFKVNPGDTLVVNGNWKGGIDMAEYHGSATCPIVVINEGDVRLPAGVKMTNCTYIKLTGSGSISKYGINVSGDGTGVGVEITGRSAFIEVERINVYKKAYGVWAKQEISEARCADSLFYPNWRIDNIALHDCNFKNIGQDGLYFGSTDPTGSFRTVSCGGITIKPIPLRLSNIRIYNNTVDSCNRTGIQLSGCDSGDNRIYYNIVTRCGFELIQTQGSGIILGGMTRAWVHDNYIRQTFQHGVFLIGSGKSIVEKNNIDSSGMLGNTRNLWEYTSIFANSMLTVPANDSVQLIIRNNVVGKNTVVRGEQIVLNNTNNLFGIGNIIFGNVQQNGEAAKIYVTPGIKYATQ